MLIMHLLLGLCLLFIIVNVDISSSGSTKCLYPQVSSLIFLPSARLIFFSLPSFFFSFLSLWFYLCHNSALWSHWQIPSAFQSGAKNNRLFFYSHWLCYNAATLSGQTRGQSIISPLPIQAAVWLLSAKHRQTSPPSLRHTFSMQL